MALNATIATGLVEAARRVGCSVGQLRWLEERRIIARPRRDYAGRRVYTDDELLEIARVLMTKQVLRGERQATR